MKHVEELMEAKKEGCGAVLLFVVQMEGITRFMPNVRTQPEFAEALLRARKAGVRILAVGCEVKEDGMRISYEIPVVLPQEPKTQDAFPLCWSLARALIMNTTALKMFI